MSDNSENIITGTAGATLTNNDTISGAGQIGLGDLKLTLTNKKIIDATGTAAMTINTGNVVTNSGSLEATGGGKLVINDAVSNGARHIVATTDTTRNTEFRVSPCVSR